MKARTLIGPAVWASAIINGADVAWFTWSFPLYGGNCAGGEVTEYTVMAP